MAHLVSQSSVAAGVGIAAILALASCDGEKAEQVVNPLPKLSDIRAMTAEYFDVRAGRTPQFVVPREHWQPIFEALLPARRDDNPAKWEYLGALGITRVDGQPFHVSLFTTSRGPGAFAAGKTFEERVYYRGGTSKTLIRALDAAYEASREARPSGE